MDAVHEVGTSEPSGLPASPVHLLTADDVLAEGTQCGTYLALCGALVPASCLPSSLCPPGCECDCALYCLRCIHHVVQYALERAEIGDNEADPHDELDDAASDLSSVSTFPVGGPLSRLCSGNTRDTIPVRS